MLTLKEDLLSNGTSQHDWCQFELRELKLEFFGVFWVEYVLINQVLSITLVDGNQQLFLF